MHFQSQEAATAQLGTLWPWSPQDPSLLRQEQQIGKAPKGDPGSFLETGPGCESHCCHVSLDGIPGAGPGPADCSECQAWPLEAPFQVSIVGRTLTGSSVSCTKRGQQQLQLFGLRPPSNPQRGSQTGKGTNMWGRMYRPGSPWGQSRRSLGLSSLIYKLGATF